ncbi:MAG: DnaT-like ssDNA-binding protein [Janthinobacterium lividum]
MFVVADGVNYETANSYVSVEYADAYHALRDNAAWAAKATPTKQAALVKATDYIEQAYGQRFVGTATLGSLLAWPRFVSGVDTLNYIPDALKKAVCELALEAMTGPLNPVYTAKQAVKRKRVEGAVDIEYRDDAPTSPLRPAVIGLLSPLLVLPSLNRPVVRV